MKKSIWKAGWMGMLSAMLVLSACSAGFNLGGSSSGGSIGSSANNNYSLSTTQFVIPSQAFAVYPPVGWENLDQDSENQVVYRSPDGAVLITTRFNNTGYTLDTTAFENYINATQENFYAYEDNYAELSREMHLEEGYGSVYVSFDFNNVPQQVERLYQQEENVIFETEFRADKNQWSQNVDFFNEYLDGVLYNADNVSDYAPYMFVQEYIGGDNALSFSYYPSWQYQVNVSENDFFSARFTSPDGNAIIVVDYQNDHATSWSKGQAGQWAISTLESIYSKGSSDLKIDQDQINTNGYEQLTWHTLQDGFHGITVFYAKDTEIMKLTVVWQKDYAAVYQSALEYVISTFASPAQ